MSSAEVKGIKLSATMNKDDKIYVAGHHGMVGSALVRRLTKDGYMNIITRTHQELDLTDQYAVQRFFSHEKPDYVFLAAAKVGGIHANNSYPAEFIHINLAIQTNVIHQSYLSGVKRLLFLGSSCIYPRDCPQPIKEEYLLTGPLEPTNRPYAIAKIAGIEMCWSYNRQYGTRYLAVMPTNLYGPGDNFDAENSHVIPGLIRRFHEAKINNQKEVIVWGTGKPRREFLHCDDMADACVFLMSLRGKQYDELTVSNLEPPLINIGSGKDIRISELVELIKNISGYDNMIVFNDNYPDGTYRKLLDISKVGRLGWQSSISLNDGVHCVYQYYSDNYKCLNGGV